MNPPKDKSFEEYFPDDSEQLHVSDSDLARMMAESSPRGREEHDLTRVRPGELIDCIVIGRDEQEIIVEIDSKTTGVIELIEFEGEDPPAAGKRMKAQYRRYDEERGLAMLTVREVKKDLFWDEVRPGGIYEGVVTATSKGGLNLNIKGARGFMPISQIDTAPVQLEELGKWVGKKFTVEVTSFDRAKQEMVVSRRNLLKKEQNENRAKRIGEFVEGMEIPGQVVRVNEHGAFVDIGGVDGLLHSSKIHRYLRSTKDAKPPKVGDSLTVRVISVDAAAGRIGLDIPDRPKDHWSDLGEEYRAGDSVTGVIARVVEDEIHVTLEEGVEGVIRLSPGDATARQLKRGSMIQAVIVAIDPARRFIELKRSGS